MNSDNEIAGMCLERGEKMRKSIKFLTLTAVTMTVCLCGCENKERTATVETQATEQTDVQKDNIAEEVYATSVLKLRVEPSDEADVAELVDEGTVLTRISDDGKWSQVEYEDGTYYVMSEFISNEKP